MASKRLNEHIRNRIKKAAMDDTFALRDRKLLQTRVEIANQARREYLHNRGVEKCADKIPDDLANLDNGLRIAYGEGRSEIESLSFSEAAEERPFQTGTRLMAPRHPVGISEFSKSLQGRFHAMRQYQDRLKRERKDLSDALNGLLWSVNTTNRLLEEWPEGAKYIPAEDVKNLPAVRGKDVTKKMRDYAEDKPVQKTEENTA